MYKLKISTAEFKIILKEFKITQKDIAEKIGVDRTYISQMVNGRGISKLCAYAVCKAICKDYEIEDLFVKNN